MENIAKEIELNYFAFEHEMRKSIRDLFEPYTTKATQDREQVQETVRVIGKLTKRVKDLEHMLLKGSDVTTVFDELFQKFGQVVRATNRF